MNRLEDSAKPRPILNSLEFVASECILVSESIIQNDFKRYSQIISFLQTPAW